jgi:predicted NUDIX family NTP pyrophosphohydrolase
MLTRICAGGVVFQDDQVFILKNDKDEWVLPKGAVRSQEIALDVAMQRVKSEAGIETQVISPAGETSYEFYSYSRNKPVCNKIDWFIMQAIDNNISVNKEAGFVEGGFFPIEEALEKITYSQDKSIVRLAYRKYVFFRDEEVQTTVG